MRDYERILALVKAVTILRHAQRRQASDGRWIATVEDYAAVFDLVGEMYETTVGVPATVRAAVEAVRKLLDEPSSVGGVRAVDVARHLGLEKMAGWRHVQRALREGWLVNQELLPGRPARLVVGDPLPGREGLPAPKDLISSEPLTANRVTPLPTSEA